jgi:uncharacterized phage protein gp47/JayE
MPRFTPKRQEQIQTQMLAKVIARSDLSNVDDSSVFKHILGAAARQDDEQYYQMNLVLQFFSIDTATGDDLDERAKDIQPSTITRNLATAAVGAVVFSRAGTTGTIAIPIGTKVKTDDGEIFTTTAAGSITPTSPEQIGGHGVGRDSAPVAIVADVPGASGNVSSNTIIKFDSKPAGVDEVTNPNPTTLGADKESDISFRQRLKDYVSGLARCPVRSIESGVIGFQDTAGRTILFSHVWENPISRGDVILYIDDGTGAAESSQAVGAENVTLGLAGPPPDSAVGGETTLFLDNKPIKESVTFTLTSSIRGALVQGTDYTLNPASGQIDFTPALVATEVITAAYTYYTGLIQLAQKVVDGDPNDRENFPGLRAAGVLVRVRTPQVLIQTITAVITVLEGYDQTDVKDNVREALKDHVNSLGISDDVVLNRLRSVMMNVAGVYNVDVTAPTTDVIILDDQLARTADPNIVLT